MRNRYRDRSLRERRFWVAFDCISEHGTFPRFYIWQKPKLRFSKPYIFLKGFCSVLLGKRILKLSSIESHSSVTSNNRSKLNSYIKLFIWYHLFPVSKRPAKYDYRPMSGHWIIKNDWTKIKKKSQCARAWINEPRRSVGYYKNLLTSQIAFWMYFHISVF